MKAVFKEKFCPPIHLFGRITVCLMYIPSGDRELCPDLKRSEYTIKDLHSYQNPALFSFPLNKMSQKGGLPFPHWLAGSGMVGCFSSVRIVFHLFLKFAWRIWSQFTDIKKTNTIFIHRSTTNRLHLVQVAQRTSEVPQHVLWVTPSLSLHSIMSCISFTAVFCVNFFSSLRSQAPCTRGECYMFLLWFGGCICGQA